MKQCDNCSHYTPQAYGGAGYCPIKGVNVRFYEICAKHIEISNNSNKQ